MNFFGKSMLLSMIPLFFLYAGCSLKTVSLQKIPLDQNDLLSSRLAAFTSRPKVDAIDMDLHLRWNYLGQKGAIDTVLMMQPSALARMTALDPLGRPIYIIASNGDTFTMTDSRNGKGYTGKVSSSLWRKYLPEAVNPEYLFYFLGAMLPSQGVEFDYAGLDDEGNYWYQFIEIGLEVDDILHRIMLDNQGRIAQYLLLSSNLDTLVSFTYDQYQLIEHHGVAGSEKMWPGTVVIRGNDFQGEVTLEVENIVSTRPKPASSFSLQIPAHYTVEMVN